MSANQSEVFFVDMVPKWSKATIKEGNTLFIPTGIYVYNELGIIFHLAGDVGTKY